MKLVFFGGIAGVGKTTLLTWLKKKLASEITLLDPGELFRRYHYHENRMTTEAVEELVVRKIEKMPEDATVVIHWHYAVRRPTGYIPQIHFSRLARVARNRTVIRAMFVVVEAPINTVLERRRKERYTKKRPLNRQVIREEITRDEQFLKRQLALFRKTLGRRNVTVFRLANTNLEAARSRLLSLF